MLYEVITEEPMGASTPQIVDILEKRSVRPTFVLDEGGAIVSNIFPGVKEQCALIGVAEKGMLDLKLTAISKGGHASSPPKNTARITSYNVCYTKLLR